QMDYPDEVLKELDFVIASVHSRFTLPEDTQTARIVAAAQNPHVSILGQREPDRKSTRLNSSHVSISYAVFCLKKKNVHDASFARWRLGQSMNGHDWKELAERPMIEQRLEAGEIAGVWNAQRRFQHLDLLLNTS